MFTSSATVETWDTDRVQHCYLQQAATKVSPLQTQLVFTTYTNEYTTIYLYKPAGNSPVTNTIFRRAGFVISCDSFGHIFTELFKPTLPDNSFYQKMQRC